jgi:hypothetical protein
MISDLRRYIYDLRYELGFKIKDVTMDGFQSTDTHAAASEEVSLR